MKIKVMLAAAMVAAIGFVACEKSEKPEFGISKVEKAIGFERGETVTIINEEIGELNTNFVLYTEIFSTERFGDGEVSLLMNNEGHLASVSMDAPLYANMKVELTDQEIIYSMTGKQYLDGLGDCANKPTENGVALCAAALTLEMLKDCIDATAETEHIHCW